MNMTGSGFSTGSTIEPPPRPDPERPEARAAERSSVAAIVASLHGRTGKTLLARILADYFVLSGRRPMLFDTDAAEQTLHASFPFDSVVIDLGEVRDQMTLFDTLVTHSAAARVVDVSHHAFRRFFKVMQDSDFVTEARWRHVEPVIFYLTDRDPEAWEHGRLLRERFADCAVVLVNNLHIGRVKELTRHSEAYRALAGHDLRMTLPRLDPALVDAIEEGLSLSDLMSRPLSRADEDAPGALSFDQRTALRGWLVGVFREIHRVTREIELRPPGLLPSAPL